MFFNCFDYGRHDHWIGVCVMSNGLCLHFIYCIISLLNEITASIQSIEYFRQCIVQNRAVAERLLKVILITIVNKNSKLNKTIVNIITINQVRSKANIHFNKKR